MQLEVTLQQQQEGTHSFKFFVQFLIANSIDREILNFLKIKACMEKKYTSFILTALKPQFVENIRALTVVFFIVKVILIVSFRINNDKTSSSDTT